MTSPWHKTWSRVSRMGWDELQTRVRQGLSKRLDVAKYRAGLSANLSSWNMQPADGGTFLFSTEDLPRLTSLLHEHLSVEVEKIVCEADEICRHQFRLLGYDNLDYGNEIDWHLDAAHGKRAPLKPWFQISFLDFPEVGDHKVTWELNRHQHLVTLAKAWTLTRQEKYPAELIRQWYAWASANPFPLGINWASSLEVAFRSLSWLWVRFLLAEYSALPAPFNSDLLHALALNGRYIERYLSTYFSPNTHLLGEAVALFFIGVLCPQLSAAERWRSLGWRIVVQEAERQVRADGVYFEQSLYYHIYALDFFLHARLLAARNQVEIPPGFDATLNKMLDVVQAVSQAGPPHTFGDDDGGRVFNHARNRSEHLTDPLAVGAILFERDDLTPASGLTEEALWLFGDRAASFFTQPSTRVELKTVAFEAGGIYVMASSEGGAQQMVVDAGPLGTGRGGHGHADALSVAVSLAGQPWLVDPGTFCYISADGERDRFRGTGSHNTLRVDDLDQALADGPFAWNFLPSVIVERWSVGRTFSLFVGSHTGYSRLPDSVLHRRFVFHLRGGFWLVHDLATGQERHHLETSWHFASDLQVRAEDGFFVASSLDQAAGGGPRLALVPVQDSRWTCTLGWGETSPAYGIKQPAPVLRTRAHATLPAEGATLIVPLLRSSDAPGKLVLSSKMEAHKLDPVRGYRYEEPGVAHYMIFSARPASWTLGPWTSDAEFTYYSIRDGEVVQFISCNGTFALLEGNSVFTNNRKIARLEWLRQAGIAHVYSSDDDVTLSFSHSALQACDF